MARRLTDAQIMRALRNSCGFMTGAAKALECSLSLISARVAESEYLQKKLKEIQEAKLDLAESKLFLALDRGEQWAVRYVLNHLGKGRGYKKTTEIDFGGNANFDVYIGDNKHDSKEE